MDPAVRTYGDALAAVVVVRPGEEAGLARAIDAVAAATARSVRVVVADSRAGGPALDAGAAEIVALGEDVLAAAAVNRAVAGLGDEVGWIAATWAGAVWGPGAIDALRAAARDRPRAALLGPATPPEPATARRRGAARAGVPGGGAIAALLRPRDPWPSGRRAVGGGQDPGRPRRETPTRTAPDFDSRTPGRDSMTPGRDSLTPHPDSRTPDPDSRGGGVRLEGAVLLRRAALDSVDGFDPRFPALAVHDLARRLDRAGWLVVPVPGVLAEVPAAGPPGRHAEVRRYLAERNRGVLRAPLRVALRMTAAPG